MDIILLTNDFLNKPILDTKSDLKASVIALESLRKPLLEARLDAQTTLLNKRNQYLHPKDRNLTELDRKTMLDANTTAELRHFELLQGLEYLLKDRHKTLCVLLDA